MNNAKPDEPVEMVTVVVRWTEEVRYTQRMSMTRERYEKVRESIDDGTCDEDILDTELGVDREGHVVDVDDHTLVDFELLEDDADDDDADDDDADDDDADDDDADDDDADDDDYSAPYVAPEDLDANDNGIIDSAEAEADPDEYAMSTLPCYTPPDQRSDLSKTLKSWNFSAWHTGGGCWAMGRPQGDYYILVTDAAMGVSLPEDDKPCLVGVYADDGMSKIDVVPEEGLCEWVPAENVLDRVDAAVAYIDALIAGITPVAAWPSKELDVANHMEDADDE